MKNGKMTNEKGISENVKFKQIVIIFKCLILAVLTRGVLFALTIKNVYKFTSKIMAIVIMILKKECLIKSESVNKKDPSKNAQNLNLKNFK